MVLREEDELFDQMLELKPIVNMFMNCIMKMIGHYDANKN